MLSYTVRRLAAMVPRLAGVVLLATLLVETMPGDPEDALAGESATPEAVEAMRESLQLDLPVWERFAHYLGRVLTGDLGESPATGRPVWDHISETLPVSASLILVTMLLAMTLGVGAGTVAGLHQGGLADRAITGIASLFLAVPPFVVGLVLLLALAVSRDWLPAGGYVPITEGFAPWLGHVILPSFSLALVGASNVARHTRSAIIDTVHEDFIESSRAKGLPEIQVLAKHVAKNAASPVVTVAGLEFAQILGGTIVIERIFGMHGFGSLAVDAVLTRNIVLIQGIVLVAAVAVLAVNLLVDISYAYLRPSSRLEAST